VLEECKAVSRSDASITWVDEDFLLQEKVVPWSELPLWMPEKAAAHLQAFMFINSDKAVAAGLKFRPLNETVRDTLAWSQTDLAHEELKAGMNPDKEQRLLRKFFSSR